MTITLGSPDSYAVEVGITVDTPTFYVVDYINTLGLHGFYTRISRITLFCYRMYSSPVCSYFFVPWF